MKRKMAEPKKVTKKSFAGTLLKVIGITVASGVVLTALTDKALSKATGKDEKKNDKE